MQRGRGMRAFLTGTFAVFLGIVMPGSWTSMREMEPPRAHGGEVEREAVSVMVWNFSVMRVVC
jgi:hypothetical protein